jgi:hypothetical protein
MKGLVAVGFSFLISIKTGEGSYLLISHLISSINYKGGENLQPLGPP